MMKKLSVVFLVLFCIVLPLWAQNQVGRGGGNLTGEVEIVDARQNITASGKQWAVFIAIDQYKECDSLLYPVKDAKEIKKILLDYYYIDEVRELYNRDATGARIRRLFVELQEKTGLNDSVFIFHAGHGINEDKTKISAWIPYDGGVDIYAQANWLNHLQIRSMLDAINAKHVFLISDSCFSGDFLDATRGTPNIIVNYPAAYDKVSRQAMSSGASEAVADESEFASRLKSTLLRTKSAYITPDFLLSQIKEAKTARPLYTIPILAVIPRSSRHQLGGSFLFFRKNGKLNEIVQPAPDQNTTPAPITSTDVIKEPAIIQVAPGEHGYFVGSWIATVEYNNSFDTYEINLSANRHCKIKITNDNSEQETTGNWDWDGTMFTLNAVFRNAKILYQRNIDWKSPVNFAGGNSSFNILAKPASTASNIRYTFFRDN
jgi:hypothetical protein